MKRLRAVLASFVDSIHLGDPAPAPLEIDRLREQLRRVSRANEHYFGVCVVMLMVMFVGALWVTLRYTSDAGAVKIAFAAFGVMMIGMMRVMLGLWREKVATDVLLALAGSLEGDHLRSIIAVLLKRLG